MTQPAPLPSKDQIQAFAAAAVVWLLRLLGVVLAPGAQRRRQRLRRFIESLEREVESILFLKALHAFGPLLPRARTTRPRSVPMGSRRTRGNGRRLLRLARIRVRGVTFVERITRLFEALAHDGVYVARFLKRLKQGVRIGGLIPCLPPTVVLNVEPTLACAFADTS